MLPLKFTSPAVSRVLGLSSMLGILAASPAWGAADGEADAGHLLVAGRQSLQRAIEQKGPDEAGSGGVKGGVVTPAGQKRLGVTEPVGAILRAAAGHHKPTCRCAGVSVRSVGTGSWGSSHSRRSSKHYFIY